MRTLAVLLLSTFSMYASAQTRKKDVRQSVSDDGKTMRITIKSSQNGKEIDYDHSFAVGGMSKYQKDALLKHVNDSLGIKPPPAPQAHH